MSSVVTDLEAFRIESILSAQDAAQSLEELQAITKLGIQIAELRLAEAVADFRQASVRFLDVTQRLIEDIQRITANPATPKAPGLEALLKEFSEIHRALHDDEGMRTTHTSNEEVEAIEKDEAVIAPPPEPTPLPDVPPPAEVLHAPVPLNSKSFETLADEYVKFFLGADYKKDHKATVKALASKALAFRTRYEEVGDPIGIPWWFIAGLHLLESTYNFGTHLHNGDPLTKRTFRVPSGRPKSGTPPFRWEGSARDALVHQKLNGLEDWSLPRALWRWERYNGWGYRGRGVATPYLWSFSTIYKAGKFVGDGVFSKSAVSRQCGAAVLLRALHEDGHVPLKLDVVSDVETNVADADADAENVVNNNLPNIDNNVPDSHPFETFFRENLPGIQHFNWHEFLVKGGSHAANGLNTDPPRELWPSVIPLIRALDRFRQEMGHPVILTSVYRSPAYNASLSGSAKRSQHMAFTAADVKVVGSGMTTGEWANRLKSLRSAGLFEGGVGIYNTFVHVDVRGTRADWDER